MVNAANSRDGVCYKTISKFIPGFVAYGRVDGFSVNTEFSAAAGDGGQDLPACGRTDG
jgi:hypothetical protein